MWKIPAIVFAVGWVGSILVISILRPIVHARRERTRGIGGTQDIAMYGTLFGLVCMIGTGICYYLWLTGEVVAEFARIRAGSQRRLKSGDFSYDWKPGHTPPAAVLRAWAAGPIIAERDTNRRRHRPRLPRSPGRAVDV